MPKMSGLIKPKSKQQPTFHSLASNVNSDVSPAINFYRLFLEYCTEVATSLIPLTGGQNGPIEMSN